MEEEQLLTLDMKRVLRELPWRRQIVVGDKIDAISQAFVAQNRISHWAPGTVISLVNER